MVKYPYGQLFQSGFPGFRNGTVESLHKPRILALTSSLLTKDVVSTPASLETVIIQLEQAFRSNLRTSVSLVSVDRFGYTKAIRVVPYSVSFFSVSVEILSLKSCHVCLFLQLNVREDQRKGTALVKGKLEELHEFLQACLHVAGQRNVEKIDSLLNFNAFNIFKAATCETLECLRVLGLWPTYRVGGSLEQFEKLILCQT